MDEINSYSIQLATSVIDIFYSDETQMLTSSDQDKGQNSQVGGFVGELNIDVYIKQYLCHPKTID